jgi:hypothetical protein
MFKAQRSTSNAEKVSGIVNNDGKRKHAARLQVPEFLPS